MEKTNITAGFGALALGATYLWFARDIPISTLDDPIGAAALPQFLGWAMLVLGLVMIVVGGLSRLHPALGNSEEDEVRSVGSPLRPLVMLCSCVAYILLAPHLGFVISAAVAMLLATLAAGKQLSPVVVLTALGLGSAFWMLFVLLLGTRQPEGPIETFFLTMVR
jgi:hypothetical protein